MMDGFTPKRSAIDSAINEVIKAARRVEYWTSHGTHGDGKQEDARKNLKSARVALKKAIRQQAEN